MKIPRISNPEEYVDVKFLDRGNIGSDTTYEFTSVFTFNGGTHTNITLTKIHYDDLSKQRYISDCEFLKKFDLNLDKAIFN